MPNDKKPLSEGYVPSTIEKGYQPTRTTNDRPPVTSGYQPTKSEGSNPTNAPPKQR